MTIYYHVYSDNTLSKKLCVHYNKKVAMAIAEKNNGIVVEKPHYTSLEIVEMSIKK